MRAYFDRLAAGDAAGALTYVVPPENTGWDFYPLLTDTVIADPATRPSNVSIVDRTRSVDDGVTSDTVAVTFSIGDTQFNQTLTATAQSDGGFLLTTPFLDLDLYAWPAGNITVNGVDATTVTTTNGDAFPGTYTVDVSATSIFAESSTKAKPGQGDPASPVALPVTIQVRPPAELAEGATAFVQQKVDAYLDRCLEDHTVAPTIKKADGTSTHCPFSLSGADVPVTWSYVSYPVVGVSIVSGAVTNTGAVLNFTSKTPGVVAFDLPAGYIDDQFDFDFRGLVYITVTGLATIDANYSV